MKRLSILAVAAALGAFGMAGADVALAKKKKGPAPQKYSCKTSKGAFKDNLTTRAKDNDGKFIPMGLFSKAASYQQLVVTGTQVNIGRTGTGSTKILQLIVQGVDDVREATLPITYQAGGSSASVTGAFNVSTSKFSRIKIPGIPGGGSVKTTSNAWVPDENGTVPFSLTLTKYDSVTNRLAGKFGGKMLPGDSNTIVKTLNVTKGVFTVECSFAGF